MNKLSKSQRAIIDMIKDGNTVTHIVLRANNKEIFEIRDLSRKYGGLANAASCNALINKGIVGFTGKDNFARTLIILNNELSANWRNADNTPFDDSDFDNWQGAVTTSAQNGGATTDTDLTWLLSGEDVAFNKDQDEKTARQTKMAKQLVQHFANHKEYLADWYDQGLRLVAYSDELGWYYKRTGIRVTDLPLDSDSVETLKLGGAFQAGNHLFILIDNVKHPIGKVK